ncbi:hypothetical protein E7939_21855 [Salmonella enterica]|nr:hypothetical protein [Salmonella enterica]EAT8036349.1 hypothetical protein [Salmonella enterica]EAV6370517.1 hypothetical protein [Salmonella enterica]
MTAHLLQTEIDIYNTALDFIDEVRDVVDPVFMHRIIMHRFGTQPEVMAQIMMCLAIWSSEVDVNELDSISSRRAMDRARDRLRGDRTAVSR